MKKNIYLLSFALLLVISCKNGLNDNVNLKELKLQNFVLHPAFTPLRTEYEATSSKFEYKIQVTAYPEDENAIVNIEYLYNQINILVTSSSGKSKRNYVVKLQTFSLYDLGLASLSLFSASLLSLYSSVV